MPLVLFKLRTAVAVVKRVQLANLFLRVLKLNVYHALVLTFLLFDLLLRVEVIICWCLLMVFSYSWFIFNGNQHYFLHSLFCWYNFSAAFEYTGLLPYFMWIPCKVRDKFNTLIVLHVYMISPQGALQCVQCSPGYISSIEGGVDCAQCQYGSFSVDVGSSACQDCAAGTFQNQVLSNYVTHFIDDMLFIIDLFFLVVIFERVARLRPHLAIFVCLVRCLRKTLRLHVIYAMLDRIRDRQMQHHAPHVLGVWLILFTCQLYVP